MKKYFPFISFILILSFILPFFPCFSLFTRAEDSVSSDAAYIKWEKDNVDAIRNGLADKGLVVNNDYYDDDYYYVDPDDSLWKDILIQWGLDGTDYGKPLSRVAYDYAVSNNISNTQIFNDCFNTIYNNIFEKCPYYTLSTMTCSEFLNYIPFNQSAMGIERNNGYTYAKAKLDLISDSLSANEVCFFRLNGNTFFLSNANYNCFSTDFFDNYFLYCSSSSDFYPVDSQQYYYDMVYPSSSYLPVTIWISDGHSSLSTFNFYDLNGSVKTYSLSSSVFSNYAFADPNNMLNGSVLLVPDSSSNFLYIVFKSLNDVISFGNGSSYVYQFDPNIDINQYGSDLDLEDLYDVIRDSVDDAEGNIITSINRVANNYLKDQVQLLGDIKNALNDSFGNSWLRLIHGQLDSYFPQTIDKLDALISALSSFSVGSGGFVDLSSTNTILTDIYNRLGLMLGPYNGDDFSQNTLNHITNELAGKMPFCVVTDVVVIAALFSHEPVHPDFQFPVPFQPGETFEIDISFWEYARPFINAFFIILFIIGLIVLTQKIFNSLKG